MQFRDRIKGLRRVRASELRPNPANWRTHAAAQSDALRGLLAEIGYCDALIARELEDGGLELIDGHLRAETTPEVDVPVLVVDLNETEARKLLTTLDPLAALAGADAGKLDELLKEFATDSEAVQKMIDGLAREAGCAYAQLQDIVEDQIPEAPDEAVTKPGDLIVMGNHRLLCGDSANRRRVQSVHVWFLNHEGTFKFWLEKDGQPWWRSP